MAMRGLRLVPRRRPAMAALARRPAQPATRARAALPAPTRAAPPPNASGQLGRRALGIHVADGDDDGAHAAKRALVPRARVRRRDRRERVRQAADRQPVALLAERLGERELERIAEHVVRHLLRLGDHEPALALHVRLVSKSRRR